MFLTVEAQIEAYDLDTENGVLRLAWYGWNEAEGDEFLDVYHAWLDGLVSFAKN